MPEPNAASFDANNDPFYFSSANDRSPAVRPPRPFLGIRFECCRTYGRIYRNDAGTAYAGHCPQCRAAIVIPISHGGTSARFFSAG